MLNPEALEKQAALLPDSEAVVSLLHEAVLQAAEQDPQFSTENWPAACCVITILASHDLQASRALLQELYELEAERHEQQVPDHLKEFQSLYLRRIKALGKEIESGIIRERIRNASAEEIEAEITLLALRSERPEAVKRDELILAVLKHNPERACILAYEWRANISTLEGLFSACKEVCPERLLTLILRSYTSRDKWLENWVVSLLPTLSTDSVPLLLQLLRLLKEHVRTSLVYRGTDLLLLDALQALPEGLRRECLSAVADILDLALPMVPLIVEQGTRTSNVVQSLARLWEADPTEAWERRLLQILQGFPVQERQEIARQLQHVVQGAKVTGA